MGENSLFKVKKQVKWIVACEKKKQAIENNNKEAVNIDIERFLMVNKPFPITFHLTGDFCHFDISFKLSRMLSHVIQGFYI